jgi:hypothetical protein
MGNKTFAGVAAVDEAAADQVYLAFFGHFS